MFLTEESIPRRVLFQKGIDAVTHSMNEFWHSTCLACNRCLIDHQRRLAVKSVVGQGTEFTVDLPLWKERDIRRRP